MGSRIDKWTKKLDGAVIGKKYDDTKELAVELEKEYFAKAAELQRKVKTIISSQPVILHHYYMDYAEEFAKRTQDNERWIIYLKWRRRGLDWEILVEINVKIFNWNLAGTWVWDVTAEWDKDMWY